MSMNARAVLLALFSLTTTATSADNKPPQHLHYQQSPDFSHAAADGSVAPRLQNLGNHHFPVTTTPAAQKFIDQGVNLAYGFNHAEAGRAFAEAARLDPKSAMALWGQALVLGPNINNPMDPTVESQARQFIQRAQQLAANVSPRERAYISALAKRYTGNAKDRRDADHAYTNAMRDVARRFPNDLDASALFVESLMDLRPWAYWMGDGTPYKETREAIATLRNVMKRAPTHPGALHFWVHLWEPTPTPEVAEQAADKLVPLMPGAGHLVHMPGHIYLRVGRYQDAIRVNELAAKADEDYISQCHAQGFYSLAYYPHNVTFIWMGAMMSGQGALAVSAADKAARVVPDESVAQIPLLQTFKVLPLYARVRFARWDEILAQKSPAYDMKFYKGIFHYAQGMAHNARGENDAALAELKTLQEILDDPKLNDVPATSSANDAESVLRIAQALLAGEIDARHSNFEKAIAHFERAVRYEDALVYNEPSDWPEPARQHLGAVLLAAGHPAEAASVYWEDLRRNRENGWSLFGLTAALRAQGKDEDAALISARFTKIWKKSDVALKASRILAQR